MIELSDDLYQYYNLRAMWKKHQSTYDVKFDPRSSHARWLLIMGFVDTMEMIYDGQ